MYEHKKGVNKISSQMHNYHW